MNPKLYPDYTFDKLLSELVYLGERPNANAERIEMVKDEIRKRFRLLEAHNNKKL